MDPREPHAPSLAKELLHHSVIQGLLLILAACVVGAAYLMPTLTSRETAAAPPPRAWDEDSYGLASQYMKEQMARAHGLFAAQKWAEASQAYREVTEEFPGVGLAWHRLGYALHVQGKIDEAIPCHQQASKFANYRAVSLYNLGCAYALKKDKGTALQFLREAVDDGFRGLKYFDTDTDLDYLRTEPEFRALHEEVRRVCQQTALWAADCPTDETEGHLPDPCNN